MIMIMVIMILVGKVMTFNILLHTKLNICFQMIMTNSIMTVVVTFSKLWFVVPDETLEIFASDNK